MMAMHRMVIGCREQELEAIARGFKLTPALRLQSGAELKDSLCRAHILTAAKLDANLVWVNRASIDGEQKQAAQKVFRFLKSIIKELSAEDLRKFVVATTASECLPDKLSINIGEVVAGGFPTFSTCASECKLPVVENEADLEDKLMRAIAESSRRDVGFHRE